VSDLKNSHKLLIITGILLLVGGFFWFYNPNSSNLLPPCPFKYTTGLNCPGCGSTRGLYHLFHGELFEAFAMNPLMVIALPFVFWMFFNPPWTRKAWIAWLIFAIFVSYGVLRNLPFQPFHSLAPGVMLEISPR